MAVPDRNQTIFRCIIQLCYHVESTKPSIKGRAFGGSYTRSEDDEYLISLT